MFSDRGIIYRPLIFGSPGLEVGKTYTTIHCENHESYMLKENYFPGSEAEDGQQLS